MSHSQNSEAANIRVLNKKLTFVDIKCVQNRLILDRKINSLSCSPYRRSTAMSKGAVIQNGWLVTYRIISNFRGTVFSWISRSNRPSRKYILANILLNHSSIHNQLPFAKLKTRNTLPNGNSQNIHPVKIRDYTVRQRSKNGHAWLHNCKNDDLVWPSHQVTAVIDRTIGVSDYWWDHHTAVLTMVDH